MPHNYLAHAVAIGIAGVATLGAVEPSSPIQKVTGTPIRTAQIPDENAAALQVLRNKPALTNACLASTKFVIADALNIRTAPGYFGEVVGQFGKDTRLTVADCKAGWARIGPDLWVADDYLSVSPPKAALDTAKGNKKRSMIVIRWGDREKQAPDVAATMRPRNSR